MKTKTEIRKMHDNLNTDYLREDYMTVEFNLEFIEGFIRALKDVLWNKLSEAKIKELHNKTFRKLRAVDTSTTYKKRIHMCERKPLIGEKNGYAFCLNYDL